MHEGNEAVVRRLIEEVLNRGQTGLLAELLAADHVGHDPLGDHYGPEGMRIAVEEYRAAFPDLRVTVEDLVTGAGKGAHYSNTGYILLGLIIEEATGQGYAERLHARILDPLGLEDTFYAATEPVPGEKVDAYQQIEGKLVNVSAIDLSSPGAAGAMVSTTRDLARFAEALIGGELLRPATLAEMVTFIPSGRPNLEVGLGVFRWQMPSGALVGNSGDGIGSAGRMYRLADTDLTLVLLANTSDAETVDAVFTEAVRVALETDLATG